MRSFDQLRHVLVAGRDHARAGPSRAARSRQRADHVVGLDARDAQQRQAERLAPPRSAGRSATRRSSGIGGRCALYSANRSSRKVLPGASNTTRDERRLELLLRASRSMLSTPSTAPVGSPLRVGERRQRVEGPVQVRRAVDQDQCAGLTHRGPPVPGRHSRRHGFRSAGPAGVVAAGGALRRSRAGCPVAGAASASRAAGAGPGGHFARFLRKRERALVAAAGDATARRRVAAEEGPGTHACAPPASAGGDACEDRHRESRNADEASLFVLDADVPDLRAAADMDRARRPGHAAAARRADVVRVDLEPDAVNCGSCPRSEWLPRCRAFPPA